jgi:acyl transferase domain-containing protein/acyl carrier protein
MEKAFVGFNSVKLNRDMNSSTSNINIEETSHRDIAIIGISAKLPMSDDIEDFWLNIKNGCEFTCDFPEDRKADVENYLKYKGSYPENINFQRGAYLSEIDKFDYAFFQLSPMEACLMNPIQRLFTETAWEAVEDAGYGGKRIEGSRTGVYIGLISDLEGYKYKNIISDIDPSMLRMAVGGNLSAIIPSRLSYLLDLKGPSLCIDTACSSSLVALHMACQGIRNGECDMAVAGGVRIILLPVDNENEKIGIESSDGYTRTFDEHSDGSGMGEGVVAMLLKPFHKARMDGDTVYAVIKGSAINQDGSTMGITAPNPKAQADVVLKAWENAGINLATASYIEAHGTGTRLGDTMEIQGLKNVFEKFTSRKQFCAIGSLKSNLGHMFDCAGIAGLLKALLALDHKQIPPAVNFNLPNKKIDFYDSPMYINTRLKNWEAGQSPRRCGISSFGLSGTNCHVVLEEAPPLMKKSGDLLKRPRILAISAKSKRSLEQLVCKYNLYADGNMDSDVGDICYTACTGRGHYRYRLACIVKDVNDMKQKTGLVKSAGLQSFSHDSGGCIFYKEHKVVPGKNDVKNKIEITESEKTELNRICQNEIEKYKSSDNEEEILKELCRLYVNGAVIEWEGLYRDGKFNKVNLPVYQFEHSRCWVDIPAYKKESLFEKDKLFYTIKWKRDSLLSIGCNKKSGRTLLFKDTQGIGNELAEILASEGRECVEVGFGEYTEQVSEKYWKIRGDEADYVKLFEKTGLSGITQIIHVSTADYCSGAKNLQELEASQKYGVNSLFHIVRTIMKNKVNTEIELVLVSKNVNAVTKNEQAIGPEGATIFGLGKVVNIECPKIKCRCIDLDDYTPVSMIIKEMKTDSKPYMVAYRDGERYSEEFDEVDIKNVPDAKVEIRNTGVYLISGGLGKIGLSVSKYLSARNRVILAMIGRSKLPGRETWEEVIRSGENEKMGSLLKTINEIESTGSQVIYYCADIEKLEEVGQVLKELRDKYGRINGIIHAAGVTGNGFIENRDRREFDKVLLPKVYGTWVLNHLTLQDEPDFFVMFSSGVSMIGEPGLGDYTAANSYLDAFAAYRRLKGKHALAIDWVVWEKARMAEGYSVNIDGIFKTLTAEQGIYAFDKVLSKDLSRVLIGEINISQETASLIDRFPFAVSDKVKQILYTNLKKDKSEKKREVILSGELCMEGKKGGDYSDTERKLAQIYRSVLGFNTLNIYENFFELGGNSILLTRMYTEIEKAFPGRIQIADLFAYTSINALANYLSSAGDENKTGEVNGMELEIELTQIIDLMENGELTVDQLVDSLKKI